jgi:Ca2+-transporting ATPase
MHQPVDFSALSIEDSFSNVESSPSGLTKQLADKRRLQFGPNELPETKKKSILSFFFKQFKSILVGVLIIAAGLSWMTGHTTDAYIILVVVLIDALIGFCSGMEG